MMQTRRGAKTDAAADAAPKRNTKPPQRRKRKAATAKDVPQQSKTSKLKYDESQSANLTSKADADNEDSALKPRLRTPDLEFDYDLSKP